MSVAFSFFTFSLFLLCWCWSLLNIFKILFLLNSRSAIAARGEHSSQEKCQHFFIFLEEFFALFLLRPSCDKLNCLLMCVIRSCRSKVTRRDVLNLENCTNRFLDFKKRFRWFLTKLSLLLSPGASLKDSLSLKELTNDLNYSVVSFSILHEE